MKAWSTFRTWLLICCMAAVLTACAGDASAGMTVERRDGTAIYHGTEYRVCRVDEGEQLELHVSVSRQDGKLDLSVLRTGDQEYAYRGRDIPTSEFDLLLPEAGEYQIEIHAENFQGSYEISDPVHPETN